MAEDGSIKYKIGADTAGIDKSLADIEKKAKGTAKSISDETQKFSDNARRGAETVSKITTAVLAAEAAMATAVVGSGLKFNAELEQYQTSFEVMTGSAEKAYEIVDRIKTQAAQTPFDLNQLAKTTQLMMNYGIEGDKALDMMKRLGDIAQGDAQKLDSVSLAFSQMTSLGRVTLQDIKQMINGGFNPLQEISERTGESMESLYDRISKGTLSVNEINDAIIHATSVGGKYFNSMEKQSKTFNGRWNTLKDTVREASGKIVSSMSTWLADDLLPKAIKSVQWLGDNFERLVPAIAAVTSALVVMKIAANMDTITQSVKAVIAFLSSSAGIWGLIIAALAAATALCVSLGIEANKPTEEFQQWKKELDGINGNIEAVGDKIKGIPDFMQTTSNSIQSTTEQATAYIDRLAELEQKSELTDEEQKEWNDTLQALSGIIPNINSLIDDQTGEIKGGTDALRDYLAEWQRTQYIQAMSDAMSQAIQTQMEAVQARSAAYEEFERVQGEYINLSSQEQAMIASINETFGLQVTSLEEAYSALDTIASQYGDNSQAAADMMGSVAALNTELAESKTKVDLAKDAVASANKEVDNANSKVAVITSAQDKIMRGTGDLNQVFTDAIEDMVGESDRLAGQVADDANSMEGVTSDMAVLLRRNYDEGLVRALNDAGVNSVAAMSWLTSQTSSQIKSWNELFAKDSKEAVSQISKAFQNSDAGQKAAELARTTERNFKPDLYGSGASAVDGAISGMEAKRGRLREKAASLASTVRSAFNVRLDIKSPSKVMADSGRYAVEGVEVGMEDRLKSLKAVAVKMADTVSVNFKPKIDTSGIESMGEMQTVQQTEMVSSMAAQVNSAPIVVQMNVDGQEFATATALPMSYALETLRLAEVRG